MEEKFKELYEKVTNIFFSITKKFDGVSERIFEQTGMKINVGYIVLGTLLVIFVAIFVKSILGWLWSML
ncbi:MAG TPA: hypothetical protein IAD08_07975 [Candidatus Scatovivens faecipullorum]|nr:hypothetical protein [Candidatus Scatovivens faecipullorum]